MKIIQSIWIVIISKVVLLFLLFNPPLLISFFSSVDLFKAVAVHCLFFCSCRLLSFSNSACYHQLSSIMITQLITELSN